MNIERGLGVPPIGVDSLKYPFSSLQVGDALFFETENEARNAARAARYYAGKFHEGFTVALRRVANGYRVFRVE